MNESAARILRDRLGPPPSPKPREAARATLRSDRVERVLRIAADLFEVEAAAFVLGTAVELRIARVFARGASRDAEAVAAARLLFEALPAAEASAAPAVLEEVAAGRGFRAAAPVLAPDGRRLGAICLVDAERRTLLSGLQRRLLAEFGGLIHWTPEAGAREPRTEERERQPQAD